MSDSTSSQHDLVLNAIDVISYRKNRPNIARIYRHLVRFSNISSATCEKLLDELVEQGRVIKVTYKGNISYRNAAKWKNVNKNESSKEKKRIAAERRTSSILSGTIAELVVRVPTYFRTGVPCKVLEDHLLSKDGRFTKESIHKLLQKELQQESLVQLDNGNYFLSLKNSNSNSTGSDDSDSNNVQEVVEQENSTNSKDEEVIEEVDDDDVRTGNDQEGGEEGDVEEEEVEESKLTQESSKDEDESRTEEFSGESDDEIAANESLQQENDKDYLPPRNLSVSTRRSSSGRISVRNKKTRYDASEYFFPSLNKRSYKSRQEKNIINKQQKTSPPKAASVTSALQKSRLPTISIIKSVQFGGGTTVKNYICGICHDSNLPISKGMGINCKICYRKAHAPCTKSDQTAAKLPVDSSNWTCEGCRFIVAQPCSICSLMSTKHQIGTPMTCGNCKLWYHRSCHNPPIPIDEILIGPWSCSNCLLESKAQDNEFEENKLNQNIEQFVNISRLSTLELGKENKTEDEKDEESSDESKEFIHINKSSALPRIREKQVSFLQINDNTIATRPQQLQKQKTQQADDHHQELPQIISQSTSPTASTSPPSSLITTDDGIVKEEESDEGPPAKILKEEVPSDIPDSTAWTSDDVYRYFKEIFGESVAKAFLKQEIDGNSLKLLRRSDVLRGLGLKLGIGLNVLYHVKMLQFRTCDLKTIWAAE